MPGRDRTSWRERPRVLVFPAVAVAIVLAIFFGHDTERFWAPFGPSHDGFNAAVFTTGGRAIAEDGLVASRIGAVSHTVSGDEFLYAHHPPFTYVEDAVALQLPGSVEANGRLPAIVSSVVVVTLMALLLHACGLRPVAIAIGVLMAFATPMFFDFGALTEPHILGLAPSVGILLLWQRLRTGGAAPAWALALLGGVAMLTSWQAGLLAAGVAALMLVERRRDAALALVAGIAAGALITTAWIVWAYHGDIGEFVDRAVLRAGSDEVRRVGVRQMVRQQMRYLNDLFPIGGWLGVLVGAIGVVDKRTRPVAAVSLGTVLTYGLVFRNGAYDHPYWLYGLMLPIALGAAAAADRAAGWFSKERGRAVIGAVLALGLVAALVITVWTPSDARRQNRYGATVGASARQVEWPEGQRRAYFLSGDTGPTDLLPWLAFYARREPFGVTGPDAVPRGEIALEFVDGAVRVVPGERNAAP